MRGAYAPRREAILVKSPSARRLAARRWALAAAGVAALGLASGLFGALNPGSDPALGKPHTGPFSYFPSE
jgi:hypothetical protein